MSVRDLIFDVGDRIYGWGRVVVESDGLWLDLARAIPLGLSSMPSPRSRCSIRVDGVDLIAVPTEFGPDGSVPGHATLIGRWGGDVLHVDTVSGARPVELADGKLPAWTTPPCAPPSSGWPTGMNGMWDQHLDFDPGDLVTSGAAVSVVIFRPGEDQAVVVVAATDADRVRAVLGPQLPNRLCVVPSRWTRDQLDSVRRWLHDQWDALTIETIAEPCDEYGQASVLVEVLRVEETLASWAETLPEGLLTVRALLAPAR